MEKSNTSFCSSKFPWHTGELLPNLKTIWARDLKTFASSALDHV
jgi:hypothetical protein